MSVTRDMPEGMNGDSTTSGLTGWPHSEFRKRKLEIHFTGSGSEYFRIWIVNLLLTLVTLSLYWPFAKARRLRYFYANTLVDGQALGFHGNAWRMFRGHVLLLVLMLVYSLAGWVSPQAGGIAFLVLCAVWPALWRAGMQFRLGNTSWRGLRFGFQGGLRPAYLAFAPVYLPLIVAIAIQLVWGFPVSPQDLEAGVSEAGPLDLAIRVAVAGLGLVALVGSPWALALIKRYQHRGYRFAEQAGQIKLPTWRCYGLMLKTLGVTLLSLLPLGLLVFLAASVMRNTLQGSQTTDPLVVMGFAIFIGVAYVTLLAMVGPFFTARFQNLVWNGTRTEDLEFSSQLRFRALFWLTLKNWLLTLITLGLYRPFAAVHTARLRLEAVSLTLDGDLESWLSEQRHAETAAAGEMAGDFFGIDMGL